MLDVHGRLVATLVNEVRPAGRQTVTWAPGNRPDGVYFACLRVGGSVATTKLLLMK